MQQKSFGEGFGGPLPTPSYRPVANPASQFSASSYGGPPGGYDPNQGGQTPPPPYDPNQGGYGQGEQVPPPPPGYDPNPGGGYGQGAPAGGNPPAGWGANPGYPPPAMPQWSDTGQGMGGSGTGAYAGWWVRFLATIIDGIIIGIVEILFRSLLGSTPGSIIALVVGFLYATLLLGGPRGQTLGLMAMGTRCVDANTGQAIGYGRAAVRWLVWEVLLLALLIGRLLDVLWPLWDGRNQTIHDKAASTVVIRVR